MTKKIELELIKSLRKITSAPLKDCQKAVETILSTLEEGDTPNLDLGIQWLKEKGLASAGALASREAFQGLIGVHGGQGYGIWVKISAETDFLSKTETFINLVKDIVDWAWKHQINTLEKLLAFEISEGNTVESYVHQMAGSVFRENVSITDYQYLTGDVVGQYSHNQPEYALKTLKEWKGSIGTMGSLVAFTGNVPKEKFSEAYRIAGRIAMHVIGSPSLVYLSPSHVTQQVLNEQRELFLKDIDSTKPLAMIEKITQGRLKKWFKENSLTKAVLCLNDAEDRTPEAFMKDITGLSLNLTGVCSGGISHTTWYAI